MNSKIQSHMCAKYLTSPRQLKKRVLSSLCANELLELGGRHETRERVAARSQVGSVLAGCPNPTVSEWRPVLWTQNVTLRWAPGDLALEPSSHTRYLGPQTSIPLTSRTSHRGFLSGLRCLWLISRCLFHIVLSFVFELRWQLEKQSDSEVIKQG